MADEETTTNEETQTSARAIAGIWEMQHYLEFVENGDWDTPVRVTEDSTFNPSYDDETYEPKYLDRKIQPTYTMGRKTTIEFEIDAVLPGDIQAKLAACEDKINVPVRYTRTLAVDVATGQALADTALAAKRAEGTLTMKPLSGEASGPMKLSGSLRLTTDFTYGTFDADALEFTETS